MSNEEDPVSADITVTSVEIPELTEEEQRDRLHLERRVERAFFEAGKGLMELRNQRQQLLARQIALKSDFVSDCDPVRKASRREGGLHLRSFKGIFQL